MSKNKKVRLSDIAARLDLSTVTISKALREHPDIAEETKKLIKETAKEMGYMPNRLARSLSSQKSKTLGVVVPKINHSFFSAALGGIYEFASEQDYEILLTVSQENDQLERQQLETLLSMQVDGILVSTSQEDSDRSVYERIREMEVPLVFFDRPVEGLGFSTVTVDDEGGARAAVEYVIKQGCRKIVHLAGYSHVSIGKERRAGYEQALETHGITSQSSWIVEGGFSEEYGYCGFKKVLEHGVMPDAVFAVTFPVGLGAVDAMREEDPSLPGEVPIIAFGNQNLNRHLEHPFINIYQPTHEMGRRAAALLLGEIDAADGREPQHIVLPTQLITPENARRLSVPENDYLTEVSC